MLAHITAVFLALALGAVASPSLVARGDGGGGGSCDTTSGYNQQCCNPTGVVGNSVFDTILAGLGVVGLPVGALVGVNCVLSSTCSQTTLCCTNDQQTFGLVNVNVQCVSL
ncbi:hypothetical protein BV22DRAFT_1048681 [Leucogyrophana mollusca]|uniref:Uncharacterized protein n=1 Tax=Leucogyrophana mollusca TaxID=85980 RepID=A0ACB8BAV9_9AGAM|nr:hypothetical protein BV22DRAFT_1048681 [Leucogyrophana mollusca]